MSNIDTVRAIYEAFGAGNIPAILDRVHDDVEWEYGAVDNPIPWLQRRRGRDGALAFFQTVASSLEITSFAVDEIVGNERVVVAIARLEAKVKATGKSFRETAEPHIWHFDAAGKVVKFRHAADTFGHAKALEA